MSTQDRIGEGCTEAVSPKTVTKIVKHDSGKSPVFRGVFKYFPKALQAVADISAMGAKKYSWGGWKDSATFADVHRFEDALGRHLLDEQVEGWYDESNLLHAAHAAWNALAKLELLLAVVPMKDPSSPNANLQKAAQNYVQSQGVAGTDRPISNTRECVDPEPGPTSFGQLSGSISRY